MHAMDRCAGHRCGL